MAKETTTTYQVTVKSKGGLRPWDQLFRPTKNAVSFDVRVLNSNTVDLGKVKEGDKVPTEKKVIRSLFKAACEQAGLIWAKSRQSAQKNEFHLSYPSDFDLRVAIGANYSCLIEYDDPKIKIHLYKDVLFNNRRFEQTSLDIVKLDLSKETIIDDIVKLIDDVRSGKYNK